MIKQMGSLVLSDCLGLRTLREGELNPVGPGRGSAAAPSSPTV
jgi:hypothetical protein